jgi:dCMP deaminase
MDICDLVASRSKCLSRKIGCVVVKDHTLLATGYNGPARGVPHCGRERFEQDLELAVTIGELSPVPHPQQIQSACPRRLLGHESGTGLEWCIASHAERNCIANAARFGVCIKSSILYINTVIPCKDCMSELINAGVMMIVVKKLTPYDSASVWMADSVNLPIKNVEGDFY